ncbi:MAG: 30S ribosome-binding factor RbfA [Bacilli bacterium]|nr:30S ribosome-binding factor RbfA [Bacilli bacterium]
MNQIKIKKIESELNKTISDILFQESTDELMKSITITGSEVSADLSFAKVYFTSLRDMDHKVAEKEMNEASDFIRKFVAQKMDLRQTPKIRFVYDESIEYGSKIEKILSEIHENEKE